MIRQEGGSIVPITISSWRFGHQQIPQKNFKLPASIRQPGPPIIWQHTDLARRRLETSGSGRRRPAFRLRPFSWNTSSYTEFLAFPARTPGLRPPVQHSHAGPTRNTFQLQSFTSASRPPEVTGRKRLSQAGAGKEDGGAQQPVRREDTGILERGQTRALWPYPRTLSPHASWQVLHRSRARLWENSFLFATFYTVVPAGCNLESPWLGRLGIGGGDATFGVAWNEGTMKLGSNLAVWLWWCIPLPSCSPGGGRCLVLLLVFMEWRLEREREILTSASFLP